MAAKHSENLKAIVAIGAAVALATGCGGAVSPHADQEVPNAGATAEDGKSVGMHALWPHYESTDELLDRADLVIEGTIVDSRVEIINTYIPSDGTDPDHPQYGLPEQEVQEVINSLDTVATIYTVRAPEGVGSFADGSDTVEVWLPGGQYEGVEYTMNEVRALSTGPDSSEYLFILGESDTNGMRSPLNPNQGIYKVDSSGAYIPLDGAINDLVLSRRDIAEFESAADV